MRHFQGFLNTVYVSTPLFTETETPADAFINEKMHLVASRAEKNKKPLLIFRWEKNQIRPKFDHCIVGKNLKKSHIIGKMYLKRVSFARFAR